MFKDIRFECHIMQLNCGHHPEVTAASSWLIYSIPSVAFLWQKIKKCMRMTVVVDKSLQKNMGLTVVIDESIYRLDIDIIST